VNKNVEAIEQEDIQKTAKDRIEKDMKRRTTRTIRENLALTRTDRQTASGGWKN